jgi:hypothetical protein
VKPDHLLVLEEIHGSSKLLCAGRLNVTDVTLDLSIIATNLRPAKSRIAM